MNTLSHRHGHPAMARPMSSRWDALPFPARIIDTPSPYPLRSNASRRRDDIGYARRGVWRQEVERIQVVPYSRSGIPIPVTWPSSFHNV